MKNLHFTAWREKCWWRGPIKTPKGWVENLQNFNQHFYRQYSELLWAYILKSQPKSTAGTRQNSHPFMHFNFPYPHQSCVSWISFVIRKISQNFILCCCVQRDRECWAHKTSWFIRESTTWCTLHWRWAHIPRCLCQQILRACVNLPLSAFSFSFFPSACFRRCFLPFRVCCRRWLLIVVHSELRELRKIKQNF